MRLAAITSVGHFLPEERLTNFDLEQMVDTSDEWIRTRTGIRERRILRDPDKATSWMATRAAEEALAKRGLSAEQVDLIIVATVTPDMLFPATGCLIQKALGAGSTSWAFDVSAACSGFLFALSTGARFIESGKHDCVLVIGADKMSTIVDYTDRNTCILFGDGAAAVVLEPSESDSGIIDSLEYSDGNNWESLCMLGGGSLNPPSHETVDKGMHFLFQEGRAVFKIAVEGMAGVSEEIMKRNGLTGDDVRFLVPHQANQRIIDATARRMGITMDKVMLNIERYGNTTAATIPLCLYDWEKELRTGDNLILSSFGGGFTWGAIYVKWSYDGVRVPDTAAEMVADNA
jgi:3-oxoacyl-[acyl-carrier-protein] synthase-3